MPAEPPDELLYHHHTRVRASLAELWASRDIVYTLAERDFRAQYKQATLGIAWSLLTPVAMLVIFVLIFSREKAVHTSGIPYPLWVFVAIMCWTFFSQTLNTGGNSLLTNKALMEKTQFPRECFPLECLLVCALNTAISFIPLTILFVVYHRMPSPTAYWTPVLMTMELMFVVGVTVAVSSAIVQMRDLAQVLPIVIYLGVFINPVIWPFSELPSHVQVIYGLINPLGPIIDDVRRTVFLNELPAWHPFIAACIGCVTYLFVGYRLFKRFEVNVADIA